MTKPFWKAACTSAALSALFLAVYIACNWIAALRPHVGSYYFAWERRIPFVPAMILPYMSIDLFFVAAPFVAGSDRERRVLAQRITMAILVAGACFLLLPLKFAFDRPHVDGPLGVIFNNFRNIDRPFNEFPSLHIALWAILADVYVRHSKGLQRWFVVVWFALIALSPLLTYQHHVIDILGGLALAALCFHFFDDRPLQEAFILNRRIAIYYASGAVVLAWLAFTSMPWTGVLLWPVFSLVLVAVGYLLLGPGVFRKEDGRYHWTTWFLLGPVLAGHRLSLAYYARQCRPYDRLTDHLWIGRRLSAAEARKARGAGVSAVVDLTAELSEARPFRDLPYLPLPVLDLTAPTARQINQAIAFINQYAGPGIVYLHCKIGYSRTAAVAGAYLLATGRVESVEQALVALRHVRPSIIVRPEAMAALQSFEARQRTAPLPPMGAATGAAGKIFVLK